MMNVLSCCTFIGLFNLGLFFFFKILFCKTKPFLPAHLTCIKYISFRKMLSSASYALYSFSFSCGQREKTFNYLLCSKQFKCLETLCVFVNLHAKHC